MLDKTVVAPTIAAEVNGTSEDGMVGQERWDEIRRLRLEQGLSISQLARQLELDRKTVRRCLRQLHWQPYEREARTETLLSAHQDFLLARAPRVQYSARILFQELCRDRHYRGSYETVKRFVVPLRELASQDSLTQTRFETAPGEQSQIDWGEAKVSFRSGRRVVHFFVLTLGYSRRGFYWPSADQRLAQLLDAHERAFEHFGGHTREHLYDRARTVCYPNDSGRIVWNPTFKAFAEYWSFEPRLCRPYRAQTKGKVESGVKYLKRNFLPGREFIDIEHLSEQLAEWNAHIADQRVHGTTHELPIVRFERERDALLPCATQPSFALNARRSRIVASDYLVSYHSNRYSVPFALIGQAVEVQQHEQQLTFYHRDQIVAQHALGAGRHELHIRPEHGPGAIARNRRSRYSVGAAGAHHALQEQVEIRDLSCYERLAELAPVQP
ncbi:MAG TPA: IS21 family transposase [Steroidobacteraceae bacterium]|nr:IS21 family transposase [Steroidobacteraceae bacterium]HRX89822.1 IS21 family transposase [Steroidobacteraceae bacterium]